jgi:phage-related protein
MPVTDVIYYRELESVPVLDWLERIGRRDRRAVLKCAAAIEVLRQHGHELRRPLADYLRDGIYELRVRIGRVQYRILYFFQGKDAVVLAHGLVKEKRVRPADIELALARRREFQRDPDKHSFREEKSDG